LRFVNHPSRFTEPVCFVRCSDGAFEFGDECGLVRVSRRGAEFDIGLERLDVEAGHEVDADVLRNHERQRTHDAANGRAEGCAGLSSARRTRPMKYTSRKCRKTGFEPVSRAFGRLPARSDTTEFRHRFEAAAQVRGQHQETLDQRRDQYAGHYDRQRQHHVAHRSADHHQWNEG
jgi:hypothetical protein